MAKHELMECIFSEEVYVDLSDGMCQRVQLSELLTESKVVVYFLTSTPRSRQELINLLLCCSHSNVSFSSVLSSGKSSVNLRFQRRAKTIKSEDL